MQVLLEMTQKSIEKDFSKYTTAALIRKEISKLGSILEDGERLLDSLIPTLDEYNEYSENNTYEKTIIDVFSICASFKSAPLSSFIGQLSPLLRMEDPAEAAWLAGRIILELTELEVFEIFCSRGGKYYVKSFIELSKELNQHIENTRYLPPLICLPRPLDHNRSSAYFSKKSSIILGSKYNHHHKPLNLAVLELMNQVPFSIKTDFVRTVEELPANVLKKEDKKQFDKMKKASIEVAALLVRNGNKFYFEHKPCKRGRVYTQGYHVNPQGSSFKKAVLELAHKEVIAIEYSK